MYVCRRLNLNLHFQAFVITCLQILDSSGPRTPPLGGRSFTVEPTSVTTSCNGVDESPLPTVRVSTLLVERDELRCQLAEMQVGFLLAITFSNLHSEVVQFPGHHFFLQSRVSDEVDAGIYKMCEYHPLVFCSTSLLSQTLK